MKIFISQPMRNKSAKEINETRFKMRAAVCEIFGGAPEKTQIIESYFPDGLKTNPVKMIGESIKKMAEADVVIFAPGWREARGCKIEHRVCMAYGIRYIDYELWEATNEETELPKPVDIKLEDIEEDSEAARSDEIKSDIQPDMVIKRSPLNIENQIARLRTQLEYCDIGLNNALDKSDGNNALMLLTAQKEIIAQMDALYFGDEM